MEQKKQELQIPFDLAEEVLTAAAQLSVEVEQQKDKTSFSFSEMKQIAQPANIPPECVEQALNDYFNNSAQSGKSHDSLFNKVLSVLPLRKCLKILLVGLISITAIANLSGFLLMISLILPLAPLLSNGQGLVNPNAFGFIPLTLLPLNLLVTNLYRKDSKNSFLEE